MTGRGGPVPPSPAFRESVHREKRDGTDYVIAIGKAQSAGFDRLMHAMFTRVVPVTAVAAGAVTDPQVRGVFEPVLEDFSFVTPRDTGTPLYAVSLKYRINAYTPAGQAVDSWTFTGYGAQASSSVPGQGKTALQQPPVSRCATRAPRSRSNFASRRSCAG